MAYLAVRFIDDAVGRWLMTGMGVFFVLLGSGGALWRYDLAIDLMARTYRGRRGFLPAPRRLQGSLDELDGVELTRRWRSGDDSSHAVWVVGLDFRSWDRPLSLFETTSERKGYAKLETLSRLLRADAIDRTGPDEVRRPWDDLDRAIGDQAQAASESDTPAPADPPAGSAIEWTRGETGSEMVVLPAPGFNAGTVLLVLFSLPFAAFGTVALLAVSGAIDIAFEGSDAAAWIVGAVFVFIGLVLCAGAVFGSVAREIVRLDAADLVFSLRAFGREYRVRRLPRREIEEIAIKPSSAGEARDDEVVVRSKRRVLRIGSRLNAAELEWLQRALTYLACR
jgi:hypothetical protein